VKLISQIILGIVIGGVLLLYIEPLLPPLDIPGLAARRPDPRQQALVVQQEQLALMQRLLEQSEPAQQRTLLWLEDIAARIDQLIVQDQLARNAPAAPAQDSAPSIQTPEQEQIMLPTEQDQRKEIAWKQFYIKPDKCLNMTSQEVVVECGNDHIRKRREFEELWEQNLIR